MPQHGEQAWNLTRTCCQAYNSALVGSEQLVKDSLRTQVLCSSGPRSRLAEQEVEFREAGLDGIARETGFDVCKIGARIAGMNVDSFTAEFFDFGDERVFGWQK